MAQKKVILKDGSDDLLPKTLASMVFTEAGQTVEAALQSAGGGGSSSGGGTGNVNVTNGSGLQKDAYYAFQPSAAGSLTGKFATLPYASSTAAGLMSGSDKKKLDAILPTIDLPSGLKDLTAESTDEQVFDVFAGILTSLNAGVSTNYPNDKLTVGYYGCLIISMIQTGQDGYGLHWTLGNNPVSASFEVQASEETGGQQYPLKGTASFTYITSGRLRTVTLTATLNSSGDTATYDFTAKVEESGDDTYWLPTGILNLKAGATLEEIEEVFGGRDAIWRIAHDLAQGKTTRFLIANRATSSIPVSAGTILSINLKLVFFIPEDFIERRIYWSYSGANYYVKDIYTDGYPLSPSLYSLTTSSATDDISAAVGGEAGLKEIIQAVKDGNRLVIRGAYSDQIPITSSTEVISVGYNEGENGDMQLFLSYWVYAGIGATHKILSIAYTKSSNTFAVSASQDIS